MVHFTDIRTEATDDVIEAAEEIFTTAGVEGETEIITDTQVSKPRSSTHIGKRVLQLVDDREYDHVIMGHHGTGAVGELILGSTAKTVIEAGTVPVTVVP
ncbi:UspA domain-containing protein [Natrinema pallidum DSM 3751]|uniref:UspA domain-containing protein n=2 Tax=Natrinema TaxID=88723 RepID=L9YDQ6_NATP1|nr:UspA domain-containing protein [Natrinema pellirubrum DSM 15624]ELY81880.1 UspA domain-containing protein [Natrinema pallidum DSM 3751]